MVLICGIPNAGKTTFSKKYENVIHVDDFAKIRKERGDKKLTLGDFVAEASEDICVEGVMWRKANRESLVKRCGKKRKVCIWLDTPLEICIERETRGRSRVFFEHEYAHFEPPTYSEGWDEIIIIHG